MCAHSTAIGIRCKDGVVFGVEKLVLSKLYEEGSNKRIFNIDRHVGMVTTDTNTNTGDEMRSKSADLTVSLFEIFFLFYFIGPMC